MGTGWAAGGTPGGRRRLGEVLVAGKVLTEAQLDEALRVQRDDTGRRRRLGEVITSLGLADEVQIARALSDELGLPFLDLGSLPIPEETLAVLPRNVAQRHGAVPVTLAHDVLTVALADPTNVLALDDIRLATKLASDAHRSWPDPACCRCGSWIRARRSGRRYLVQGGPAVVAAKRPWK